MNKNLELLKSIHENGGCFEVTARFADPQPKSKLWDYEFSIEGINEVYRIPSELEVERKIVELLPEYTSYVYDIHKEKNKYWVSVVLSDHSFYKEEWRDTYEEAQQFRFTAGLMLWDKLLKEKRLLEIRKVRLESDNE